MPALSAAFDSVADRLVVPGYTKVGFLLRRRTWQPLPAGVLRGKRAMVTGANSGLGAATTAGLAELGAHVHLVVRDRDKGDATRDEIMQRVPGAHLTVEQRDVSIMDTVREFAADFQSRQDALDILVHNAGVLPPRRQETREGNEITLATHVLGPFLLTGLLAPALRTSTGGRVIFMSSGGMYTQPLRIDDPQYRDGTYRGATAYARTKRMQVVLAHLWSRELADDGMDVYSMHPGWAATPGVTDSLPGFARVTGPVLRNPEQGADTAVWLAAAAGSAHPADGFWHDRTRRPAHYVPWTKERPSQRERLWSYCLEATGLAG